MKKSLGSFSVQKERYLRRRASEGRRPDNDEVVKAMNDYFDLQGALREEYEKDPSWREHNLEYDLRSTEWICDKVTSSPLYAQNLYAALCNNSFQKNEMFPILKDQRWSCSWRYAGGIVADMQEKGDYLDWYCSGIRSKDELTPEEFYELSQDEQVLYKEMEAYVGESVVTDEIRSDLKKLGWKIIENSKEPPSEHQT